MEERYNEGRMEGRKQDSSSEHTCSYIPRQNCNFEATSKPPALMKKVKYRPLNMSANKKGNGFSEAQCLNLARAKFITLRQQEFVVEVSCLQLRLAVDGTWSSSWGSYPIGLIEAYFLTNMLSAPYCAFFDVAGCFEVATKLQFCLRMSEHGWARSSSGRRQNENGPFETINGTTAASDCRRSSQWEAERGTWPFPGFHFETKDPALWKGEGEMT